MAPKSKPSRCSVQPLFFAEAAQARMRSLGTGWNTPIWPGGQTVPVASSVVWPDLEAILGALRRSLLPLFNMRTTPSVSDNLKPYACALTKDLRVFRKRHGDNRCRSGEKDCGILREMHIARVCLCCCGRLECVVSVGNGNPRIRETDSVKARLILLYLNIPLCLV